MGEDERVKSMPHFWRKGCGQGRGLALSIVSAITERYAGSFELLSRTESAWVRASISARLAESRRHRW